MFRLEYKFLLDNSRIAPFRAAIAPYVTLDPYTVNRKGHEYTVRSIYFDTSGLKYYHEKIDGLKNRKKIRIRGYNQADPEGAVFLEIKRKTENYISKNRAMIKAKSLGDLFSYYPSYPDKMEKWFNHKYGEEAGRFFFHIIKNDLKPTALVVYDREACFSRFNSALRITIDKNLRFFNFPAIQDLYTDDGLQLAQKKVATLEIKFQRGIPGWLTDILDKFGLSRRAVSKYTICLDAQRSFLASKRKSTLAYSDQFWRQRAV